MTEHTNEDVAVVREALEGVGLWAASISEPSAAVEEGVTNALVALDRLQARLEGTEAACRDSEAWLEDALAALGAKTVFDIRDKGLSLPKAEAERDEARADAERLAEALRGVRDWVREGFGTEADAAEMCDAALAAHTPHLTGPKHKPIGTFYTTEDAVSGSAGCPGFPKPPEYGELDDVGPPAPGEGDDLPNPELTMGPC